MGSDLDIGWTTLESMCKKNAKAVGPIAVSLQSKEADQPDAALLEKPS